MRTVSKKDAALRDLALDAGFTPVSGNRFVCNYEDLADIFELVKERVMENVQNSLHKVDCTDIQDL